MSECHWQSCSLTIVLHSVEECSETLQKTGAFNCDSGVSVPARNGIVEKCNRTMQ